MTYRQYELGPLTLLCQPVDELRIRHAGACTVAAGDQNDVGLGRAREAEFGVHFELVSGRDRAAPARDAANFERPEVPFAAGHRESLHGPREIEELDFVEQDERHAA